MTAVNAISTNAAPNADAQREILRDTVNEVVGVTFYGTMLRIAQSSSVQSKYGHGGRGEQAFRAQLDLELAQRAGRASKHGLGDIIYRHMTGETS